MIGRRHVLLGLTSFGGGFAPGFGQALADNVLFEVAQRLVAIYQASDADALHRLLAPDLQPHFPRPKLAAWLKEAQEAFGVLHRTSMPTYGSRHHGALLAYFDRAPADMYLQIDKQRRVVFWAFRDTVKALAIRKPA
jgi:hypothetical protein